MPDFTIQLNDIKGNNRTFDALPILKDFVTQERDFWKEKSGLYSWGNKNHYFHVWQNFDSMLPQIDQITTNAKEWDENTFRQQINQLQNSIHSFQGNWIYSADPFVAPWIESFKVSAPTGEAFFDAVISGNSQNVSSYPYLKGYILAYEYQMQDESTLTKRRNAEEKAFTRLRTQLNDKKEELIKDVDSFKAEFNEWKEASEQDYAAWYETTKNDYASWEDAHKNSANESLLAQANEFQGSLQQWQNQVDTLEQTYREKLRLDGPSKYWRDRAEALGKQAGLFTAILVLVLVLTTGLGASLFVDWLHAKPIPFSANSLQGVVLLGISIAAVSFLIRTLAKLAFSAFHLQRDAEEREQLAHLYLALIKEGSVEESSRNTVFQALFSRAESGLLANDSSPTMPSVNDILRMNR